MTKSDPPSAPLWPPGKPRRPVEPDADDAGVETLCVHFGESPLDHRGAAAPPIYQTSTFVYPDAEAFARRRTDAAGLYDYTRVGNPTVQLLERRIARLERGRWACAFASGMGAISAAAGACLEAGAHVVACAHCYWPTRQLLDHLRRFGVEVSFVHGVRVEDFVAAMRPETRLVWLESPTSGHFEILPVAALCRLAHERGATVVFDNSWATPVFQQPLELGVDLVVHSVTKYLNGHSDVVAGVVVGRDESLRQRIERELELAGASLDPFAAWLILRGLRTLPLRMRQHQASALALAKMVAAHPKVARVHHPGLPEHPGHVLAREQLRGWSGLFSFELAEPGAEPVRRLLNALRLFQIGVSWGGYESLILGGSMFSDRPDRPRHLIRVSVGLETTDDLLRDMRQALETV